MEPTIKSLNPDETVQKFLLSTTSRLTGDFENNRLLITHAWDNHLNPSNIFRRTENPASRSAYVTAFRTQPWSKQAGVIIPNYSWVGELVCSLLSVLYGKRFDAHGMIESSGFYAVPDLSLYSEFCNHQLPFNSHKERETPKIPLSLDCAGLIERAIFGEIDNKRTLDIIKAASKFYWLSLKSAESQPEIAYLNLITSGEILSSHYEFNDNDLLDDVTIEDLEAIKHELKNGSSVSARLKSKILSIKKKFTLTIENLINDDFYTTHNNENGGKITKEMLTKRIKSAYDLRSIYVHTGVPFGRWVAPLSGEEEVHRGKPVVDDKDYGKTLEMAPTLLGMERVIRYCILMFMAKNGFIELDAFMNKSRQT